MFLVLKPGANFAAKQDTSNDIRFHLTGYKRNHTTNLDTPVTEGGALSVTATILLASPAAGESISLGSIKFTNVGVSTRVISVYLTPTGVTYDTTTQWGATITLNAGEAAEWKAGGWVKTDSFGSPLYALPTSLQEFVKRVTADVAITSTPGFSDVTGLVVPLGANRKYAFEAEILISVSLTTIGPQIGFNGPASPTQIQAWGLTSNEILGLNMADVGAGFVSAYDTALIAFTTWGANNGNVPMRLAGIIENGPNAGNFAMRGRVSAAGTLNIRRGSWMMVKETDS